MFIGHFGVALAAKKPGHNIKLGTLFIAAQFLDLLWPIFLLLGLEHARIVPGNTAFTPFDFYDYPISHSLLTSIGWSILVGALYYFKRRTRKESLIIGFAVLSHWLLDFFSHRPDLPIVPGIETYLGLGLWNSVPGTIIIESLIFIIGIFFYLRVTSAKDRIGNYVFWGLILFLVLSYIANILSTPPPDMQSVAYAGLAQWFIVAWAYWVDRHYLANLPKTPAD
jgi:hypothetical protein